MRAMVALQVILCGVNLAFYIKYERPINLIACLLSAYFAWADYRLLEVV